MRRTIASATVVACGLLWAAAAPPDVLASPLGQQVASQVSATNYRHYLDDVLYTHNGMNKGIGGAQHDLCRDAILATMQANGLSAQLFPFLYNGQTYNNVVATKVGTDFPNSYYIVGAHYDSVNNPGADDDASGVAAVMEIARVLAAYDTKYSIRFIAWDREEQGLRGSTAWVAAHPGEDVRAMVQLDMITHDVGGRREAIYANTTSTPLKNALFAAVAEYGNGVTFLDLGPASFSDHAPFQSAGYQAVCFVENQYLMFGCYHQLCDSVDTPNYIHYSFGADLARTIAGYLADFAVASVPCPADLDGDGSVGSSDLAILLGSWGASGVGDLDGSGAVGSGDLAILLGSWGACP